MKNLFLATALAALALSSCDKLAPEAPGTDDLAIRFSTSTIEPLSSRAIPVTGKVFDDGAQVGVYATQTISGTTAPLMANVLLKKTGSAWDYTDHKFFVKGSTYSFVAYAPYNAAAVVDATSVKYAANADITQQADFMYAPAVEKVYADAAPDAVKFQFQHALSQVKFTAKTAQDYSGYCAVTVKKIAIAGLASEGILTFADGVWALTPATTADYSQDVNNVALVSNMAKDLANADNHVLMLLPQTLTGKSAVLTINLACTPANPVLDKDHTITLTIPDGKWEANKIYKYNVTLSLDDILGLTEGGFSEPGISDWGATVENDMNN